MKKLLYCAAALATVFFAGSCQRENLEHTAGGAVTITVNAPGAMGTKAVADGENVNEVHYAVYKQAGSNETYAIDGTDGPLAQGLVEMKNKKATVKLDLLQDQEYTVIFWAQVSGKNYYVLGDLRKIRLNSDTVNGNAEDRAAFFGTWSFDTKTQQDHSVTLYRPFSQLNLLTTQESLKPQQEGQTQGYDIEVKTSKVEVSGLAMEFDTVHGVGIEPESPVTVTFDMALTPAQQGQKTLEVNGVDYHYVAMNYLFVPVDADNSALVGINYWIDTDKGVMENNLVNVPVRENYRTNIIGNLLTKTTEFTIIVDPIFNEPALPSTSEDQLRLAAQLGGEVVLTEDLTLDSPLVVENGAVLTVNLSGHTISCAVHKSDGHVIVNNGTLTLKGGGTVNSTADNGGSAIYNNGKLTVENVTLNGASQAGSDWPAYALNNYGDATLKDVVIVSNHDAVAAGAAGTTTLANVDVTMNGFGGSSHVFYINHADAVVVINGGTYTHAGNKNGSIAYTNEGTIIINDGEFTASNGGYGIASLTNGNVIVNGGVINNDFVPWGGKITVKGGLFKKDPSTYVQEGFVVKENDNDTYSVLPDIEGVEVMVLHEDSGLFYNGNNNANKSVFYIMTAQDLCKASKYFNFPPHSGEGNRLTFELLADLDLMGIDWNSWNVMFITLNANGHTVSNVSNSFFRYAGGVHVNDLTLKNVNARGHQAGTFAAQAEGSIFTNCILEGTNTVTYVDEENKENGVGAITGVAVDADLNVTIASGTTVLVDMNTIENTEKTTFDNLLYGYKHTTNPTNRGTIVNKGLVSVKASSPIVAAGPGVNYSGELFEPSLTNAFILQGSVLTGDATVTLSRGYDTVAFEDVTADINGDLIVSEYDNTIILHNCDITLAEGKKLIVVANGATVGQVMMHNVTVNGILLTQATAAEYLEGVNWYEVW